MSNIEVRFVEQIGPMSRYSLTMGDHRYDFRYVIWENGIPGHSVRVEAEHGRYGYKGWRTINSTGPTAARLLEAIDAFRAAEVALAAEPSSPTCMVL